MPNSQTKNTEKIEAKEARPWCLTCGSRLGALCGDAEADHESGNYCSKGCFDTRGEYNKEQEFFRGLVDLLKHSKTEESGYLKGFEYTGPNLAAAREGLVHIRGPFENGYSTEILQLKFENVDAYFSDCDDGATFARFSLILLHFHPQFADFSGFYDLTIYNNSDSFELARWEISDEKEGPALKWSIVFGRQAHLKTGLGV